MPPSALSKGGGGCGGGGVAHAVRGPSSPQSLSTSAIGAVTPDKTSRNTNTDTSTTHDVLWSSNTNTSDSEQLEYRPSPLSPTFNNNTSSSLNDSNNNNDNNNHTDTTMTTMMGSTFGNGSGYGSGYGNTTGLGGLPYSLSSMGLGGGAVGMSFLGGYNNNYNNNGYATPPFFLGANGGPLSGLTQTLLGIQTVLVSLGQAVQIVSMNAQTLQDLIAAASRSLVLGDPQHQQPHDPRDPHLQQPNSRNLPLLSLRILLSRILFGEPAAIATTDESNGSTILLGPREATDQKKRQRRLLAVRWTLVVAVSYCGYAAIRKLMAFYFRAYQERQHRHQASILGSSSSDTTNNNARYTATRQNAPHGYPRPFPYHYYDASHSSLPPQPPDYSYLPPPPPPISSSYPPSHYYPTTTTAPQSSSYHDYYGSSPPLYNNYYHT